PLAIIAFVVVSSSRSGAAAGWAFIAGWVACLIVLAIGFATFFPNPTTQTARSSGTVAYVIDLAVGAAFLVIGWRWHRRATPADPTPSKLLARVDGLGVV